MRRTVAIRADAGVVHEHIFLPVGVIGHKVRSVRCESHIPTVCGDRHTVALHVRWGSIVCNRSQGQAGYTSSGGSNAGILHVHLLVGANETQVPCVRSHGSDPGYRLETAIAAPDVLLRTAWGRAVA